MSVVEGVDASSPFRLKPEGLLVSVRLTPKSSRNAVAAMEATADGESYLKVMVTVVPEDGKANVALCKLLAKTWKLAAGRISVASGATSRHKQLLIDGGDAELKARLDTWIAENIRS